MARNEDDREDLMREAIALGRRVDLVVQGFAEPVFAGLKSTGALSIYIGQDPVYQFDPDGRLRRAYAAGLLYRTQGTTLATLRRERTATETTLVRRDLSAGECQAFLDAMHATLSKLHTALNTSRFEVRSSVPENDDVVSAVNESLAAILDNSQPRLAPRIKG